MKIRIKAVSRLSNAGSCLRRLLVAAACVLGVGVLAFWYAFILPPQPDWWAGEPAHVWYVGVQCHVFGYVDVKGRWALPPVYYHATEFQQGVAIGRSSAGQSPWSYIDTKGKVLLDRVVMKNGEVIPGEKWRSAAFFHEGLAVVQTNELTIVIDEAGHEVFHLADVKVESLSEGESLGMGFSEGLMSVKVKGRPGMVDRAGRWLIDPASELPFEWIYPFNRGIATARRAGKMGMINMKGEVVVPFDYHVITNYGEDRLLMMKGDKYEECGVLDRQLHWIVPMAKRTLMILEGKHCQLYCVQEGTVMDGDGKVLFKTALAPINTYFQEGLCPANDPANKMRPCYIDEEGHVALRPPPEINQLSGPFSNGLAEVAKVTDRNCGEGLMNRQGKIVIWSDLGSP